LKFSQKVLKAANQKQATPLGSCCFKNINAFGVATSTFKTPTFVPFFSVACGLPFGASFFHRPNHVNMKKLFFLPVLLLSLMSAYAPTNYNVDVNASVIGWMGYKVTGKHTGTVKIKNGSLQMDNGVLTGGSFEIDMNTITCTDLEGEWAGKLVGHLKSEDFFGVASHPTAKLVITRAIPQDSKGNYKVSANLTIKETTKEVKFFANVAENGGTVNATGKITVDRSDYNVRYGSGSFFDGLGDKTIYDEFDLQVSLVAKK
jgi:polyisoprenoid-binding protein YceI